jgi:hypothetical protein
MTLIIKYPLAFAILYLWVGFVCAISFMEAWLKFRAPGMSLPIGLSVGKIVFSALNRMEWVFSILIITILFLKGYNLFNYKNLLLFLPIIILAIQTFWLLPALNIRIELIIQGKEPPSSFLHLYFVVLEIIKVISLSVFGAVLFYLHNEK